MFFRLPDIVIVSLIVFLVFEFVTNLEKKLECPNFNLTLFVPLIRLMYFEVIAIFVTNNPTRAQIFFKGLTRWVDVFMEECSCSQKIQNENITNRDKTYTGIIQNIILKQYVLSLDFTKFD